MWLEPLCGHEYLNPLLRERGNARSAADKATKSNYCLSGNTNTELQFCKFLKRSMLKRLQPLQLLIIYILHPLLMMIWVR